MTNTLSGKVQVSTPGAPAIRVDVARSGAVAVSPGMVGPQGGGVRLDGAVPSYADLPTDLGDEDAGASWVTQDDGLLYVWSGTAWPPAGAGSQFRGDKGDRGTGVESVSVAGSDLSFGLSDGTSRLVTVPALVAASSAATEAVGAADQAVSARSAAESARDDAVSAAGRAEGAADGVAADAVAAGDAAGRAEVAADAADASAEDAGVSAGEAAASATAAGASATAAAGDATAASGARDAAVSAADSAQGSATAAAADADRAEFAAANADPTALDAVQPTGTVHGDRYAVIDAATQAEAAGVDTVRLADGEWLLDGLTPSDIAGRRLVTGQGKVSPASMVAPVTDAQLASVAASSTIVGGRGRIAIHVDDATPHQWSSLFPLTQSLGITLGVAWHTANGAEWMTEAHRHGWEILAHLPSNIRATDALAAGTLDALAAESLDAVRAATGQDRVGFVYPQHARSLATDEVLAKYYTFGRGIAEDRIYPTGVPHPWLTAAFPLDPHFSPAGISDLVKRLLRNVAVSNGQMVFYMHWDLVYSTGSHPQCLRELVTYARTLGIEIVNPGQIWGDWNLVDDRFFEDTSQWALSGHASWDESKSYHGTRSVRIADPGGTGLVGGRVLASRFTPVESTPGQYTVLRVSYRVNAPVPVSTTLGIELYLAEGRRRSDGAEIKMNPISRVGCTTPATGGTIQSDGWARQTHIAYLPPDIGVTSFSLVAANLAEGSEVWLDDFRVERLGTATYAAYEAQMNGTGNVVVQTNNPVGASESDMQVIPQSPPVGTITATPWGTNRWVLKSTSAEDQMKVTLRLQPRAFFYDTMPTAPTGA